MNKISVCIPTAGRGTRMGAYSDQINKALLPINKKAIISHILVSFPENTEFIIALGYQGKQVRNYLTMAHNDCDIKFVEVDNYDKPGSGPGYSLLCCESLLQKAFYFISCDTLWNNRLDFSLDENWMGVAKVDYRVSDKYCNFKIYHGRIVEIRDKELAPLPPYKAFVGLCYIKDYDIFWEGLKSETIIAGEHQISNGINAIILKRSALAIDIDWDDVGDFGKYKEVFSKYEKYDFSKSNEFIYILNKKVIKFFLNSDIADKRVEKSKLNPSVFPRIDNKKGQFYSYDFVNGKTLYEYNNINIFKKLLQWLQKNLWSKVQIDNQEMMSVCKKFYYDKTMKRLKLLYERCQINDEPTLINGIDVVSTKEILEKINWDDLYSGIPVFFHGDLQFDNIIYDEPNDKFVLLDWRQDFGGHVEWGDLYYDLAKLYGGIVLNYDFIKQDLLSYQESNNKIIFDFAQRFTTQSYLKILSDFIELNGWNLKKIRVLVGLIYLNMSPLHNYPFSKMLYSLGRLKLSEEIKTND